MSNQLSLLNFFSSKTPKPQPSVQPITKNNGNEKLAKSNLNKKSNQIKEKLQPRDTVTTSLIPSIPM